MNAPRSSPEAGAQAPRLRLQALHRLHVGPIDLSLCPGECISVMGASGAGKSVLLRMIADLDPHEGQAWLDGVASTAMPAPLWRRQVTYVPAESGWWDDRVAPHFAPDFDFARWLPMLALDPAARDWPVARLSTGERQRLALLRAIRAGVTRVLLLDEPTSGLDPEAVECVERLLAMQQHAHGVAIILVTHAQAQADRMASRQYRLESGQLAPVHAADVAANLSVQGVQIA